MSDWHDAQVIEATTPFGDPGRFYLVRRGECFHGVNIYNLSELSDVRVIVDRDGRVVPPPITDEMVLQRVREDGHMWKMGFAEGRTITDAMVEGATRGLHGFLDCDCDSINETHPHLVYAARAALNSALGDSR